MNTGTTLGKEIVVTTPDRIGVLSEISNLISKTNVNIRAVCAYAVDKTAHLRMITDDNKKTMKALHDAGFDSTEHNVVIASVSPHSVHPEVGSYAEGFDVGEDYWCASARYGEHAMLIFPLSNGVKMTSVK